MESDQSAFAQNSIPIVPGGLQSGSLLDLKAVMDKTRIFRAFKVKPNSLMRMVESFDSKHLYLFWVCAHIF